MAEGNSTLKHSSSNGQHTAERVREWRARLVIIASSLLAFATLSGLAIWLLPFSIPTQVTVIAHTIFGVLLVAPLLWYAARHLLRYWRSPFSHIQLLGYVGTAVLLVCLVSGFVVTWEAAFGVKLNYTWDLIHIISTFAVIGFLLPHILAVIGVERKSRAAGGTGEVLQAAGYFGRQTAVVTLASMALVALAAYAYTPLRLHNEFPSDYSFKYGKERPFAPSLARTQSGTAMDSALVSGSQSCGTSACHEQILSEWQSSAHRYSAMDAAFQAVQKNMAKQNGPESTRYCGGCHDPISLFSGTKNLYVEAEKLTSLHGFQEGVSCLTCHSIRKVDLKGNANYVIAQPARYMFEMEYDARPTARTRFMRDFLIRAYPKQHLKDLSKSLFKTPEYCAACHKQFVDQEINNVGWVQLQNQYDNWRQSRWNHPGDARTTIECRECHMPLATSKDPAAGDANDYNRTPGDGKHRSHRFIAANQMMPAVLKLPGWEQQIALTQKWLQGGIEIPEIASKWTRGPAVALEIETPEKVRAGEKLAIKLVMTSNKVGHDFPTGPLDIIQSWLELVVTDDSGRVVFSSGTVDNRHFIAPGTFMFKAEPVDQNGALIDRHNLWEMVGVRYRRSLFPGFSDTAEFSFLCPPLGSVRERKAPQQVAYTVNIPGAAAGPRLHVQAKLRYRKADQFLLNFIFGEKSGLTAPITDMATQTRTIEVEGRGTPARPTVRSQKRIKVVPAA